MGLPIHDEAAASQAQDTPSSTPASALPPAALDLAAKLFDLARTGETSELRSYVVAGIPKNLTNHAGDTLIMLSAYHGQASTVSMLLELGADPNVLNERGQSPIAGAVFKGWDEVVKVLFEGGADITLGTPNAVDCAHMFRKEDYLKLFGVLVGDAG
ncbi:ankyrin [Mytilinidion resinicola]|uniref:Ankyrin n=1 Tax=Mytilinidion resinicola TaxID=574789 RepID=A0A6A6ZB40_9PEZI|nr:ankyrin [Mytilinidion resinicola]KAF2817525.1 ankyrin [Mytilinidion resinicola]